MPQGKVVKNFTKMYSKDTNNNEEMPPQAKVEFAYFTARNIMLMIVAITSVLVTYRLGGIAAESYHLPTWADYAVRNFAVFLGLGFDLILITALGGISMPSDSKSKLAWVLAALALTVTLVLSLCSNWFFSEDSGGPSHYNTYQATLLSKMREDSINKSEAIHLIAEAGEVEASRIAAAKTNASTLLQKAISAGSKSWQNDYQKAKNNPRAWFWVCTKCPSEYKAYRDGILEAKEQGAADIAAAYGYSQSVADMVSPTLSKDVTQDSTIMELKLVTGVLEQERKGRTGLLFWILTALAVGAGIMAMVLSLVLRDHRKQFGQHIAEDHIEIFVIVFDLLGTAKHMVLDLLQNVLVRPYQALVGWGVIQPYQTTNTRWSLVPQGTNNQQSHQHQQSQQSDTNNQQDTNTSENQQEFDVEPLEEPEQPTSDIPTAGDNKTAGRNPQLAPGARELVRISERCRQRFKRSYTSKTPTARATNLAAAEDDAKFLRKAGATVVLNKNTRKAEIQLPKK